MLRWDFLIIPPETLALGMLTFPSFYQDGRLEALTPEEQENLHFLLDTLATFQGTKDPTISASPRKLRGTR